MTQNNINDLTNFINLFIIPRYRNEYINVLKLWPRGGNIISSMSNLNCLDNYYCTLLPKGNKREILAIIKDVINKKNIKGNCTVFSELKDTNCKVFIIDEALDLAITSGGPVLIIFKDNILAYYETEFPSRKYLCSRSS